MSGPQGRLPLPGSVNQSGGIAWGYLAGLSGDATGQHCRFSTANADSLSESSRSALSAVIPLLDFIPSGFKSGGLQR